MFQSRIIIVGGGIGGLALGLALHAQSIPSDIFEAAPQIKPVGVGINILPHAGRALATLGLLDDAQAVGIETLEAVSYTRFGQRILSEPLGRAAGYDWPQTSIHRADLHAIMLRAYEERVGPGHFHVGHRCERVTWDDAGATAFFATDAGGATVHGAGIVASDGIRSTVRKQFYPNEGEPVYSGVNMWRGTTVMKPYLSGRSMVRIGWLTTGKMVIYPIRNNVDEAGNQLINWVSEIETPRHEASDWMRAGRLEDFLPAFEEMAFDWLDVPTMIRNAHEILEYPMVDRDPVDRWTFGRVTLLGDAAHAMIPRGSNGGGQAILDGMALARALAATPDDVPSAFGRYEAERIGPTSRIVLTNRVAAPDVVVKAVVERTGDKPFRHIDDVISQTELMALIDNYKRIAGYDHATLASGKT